MAARYLNGHHGRVRAAFPSSGCLCTGYRSDTVGARPVGGWTPTVPYRRDREICPRDVLLQWRARRTLPGEERVLVPSPKVPTYDLKPEMSAPEVTDVAVEAIRSGKYAFVLINYANPDMVGHTGVFEAAVKAVECVDQCVGRIEDAVRSVDGYLIVTADHGNADEMLVPGTNEVWTAHTKNPVPFVLVAPEQSPYRRVTLRSSGRLADVAPTILQLMGLEQPEEMTGQSLIQR